MGASMSSKPLQSWASAFDMPLYQRVPSVVPKSGNAGSVFAGEAAPGSGGNRTPDLCTSGVRVDSLQTLPPEAIIKGNRLWTLPHQKYTHPRLNLRARQSKPPPASKASTDHVEDVRFGCWPTPRASVGPCNTLTKRSCHDLPTLLRFEVGTPASLRKGTPNPQWLEMLMGFPRDWTLP